MYQQQHLLYKYVIYTVNPANRTRFGILHEILLE